MQINKISAFCIKSESTGEIINYRASLNVYYSRQGDLWCTVLTEISIVTGENTEHVYTYVAAESLRYWERQN